MTFNSGVNSLYADALYWTGADAVSFPVDPVFTRFANQGLDRASALIMRSDGNWEWDDTNQTDLTIATGNLASGQQDYSIAITHLKLLRVRTKDSSGKWVTLEPVNRRNLTDDELNNTGTPRKYDAMGNSMFLTPTPNYDSSGGFELQYQRGSFYFVVGDTTKTPGFAAQFHRLVSFYASLDFCDANDLVSRAAKIQQRIDKMEAEVMEFYATRDRDAKVSIKFAKDDYGQDALSNGSWGNSGRFPNRFF